MSRRGARKDPRQGSLFEPETSGATGSLQFDAALRATLSDSVSASGKSREAIAAEMERLLGSDPDYTVSRATLDAWTAPSRQQWRMPALYLPAWTREAGPAVLELIARRSGFLLVPMHQQEVISLADAYARRDQANEEIRRLTRALGGRRA
ncbi:MAG: hypothetical protein AB7P52_17605 [Alphaproteobacteria bacterium]